MAAKLMRKVSPPLLWGGIGLIILLAGVVAALYYMSLNGGRDNRLQVVSDITRQLVKEVLQPEPPPESAPAQPIEAVAIPAATPEAVPTTRTHTVLEGENLWSIARGGDLVDHPWEWRTILMQNRDKVDYAFLSSTGEGGWKVMLREGRELVVRPEEDSPDLARLPGRYVIQVAAVPDRQQSRAISTVDRLLNDGFYAYVSRARVNGELWNRIRIGFYRNPGEAQEVGDAIKALPKYANTKILAPAFWVVEAPEAELRGEVLVYGVQRLNPWVIDLTGRQTHAEALTDLTAAKGSGDFSYIYQTKEADSGLFTYHARVGYYPTYDEAYATLRNNPAWAGAQVLEVRNFLEGMPGNRFRFHATTPEVSVDAEMPTGRESGTDGNGNGSMGASKEKASTQKSEPSSGNRKVGGGMSDGVQPSTSEPTLGMEVLPSTGQSSENPASDQRKRSDASASGLAPSRF